MSHIRLEIDGKIAVVTLDRAPVNALGLDNYQEVGDVFADLAKREDLNVVVLTGGGTKAFSAGFARSMRARKCPATSTAEYRFARSPRASSAAVAACRLTRSP